MDARGGRILNFWRAMRSKAAGPGVRATRRLPSMSRQSSAKPASRPEASPGAYIQLVPMETRTIDEPASSLELIKDGKSRKVRLGEEANLGVRIDRPGEVEADVVFVGHGSNDS